MSEAITGIARLLQVPWEPLDRHLDLLVPEELRERFGLPAQAPWEQGAAGVHRWRPGPRLGTLRVEVWPEPGGEDPALVIDLADHQFERIEAAWIVLNDIDGPRYDVDRDPQDRPIPLGSTQRNLAEEERALADGMAPNQVRPGLHLFRPLIRCIEEFCRQLGVETLAVVPMEYHNAIQYERYGFTYASEDNQLGEIDRGFRPGGELRKRLDGSSPFRRPSLADTVLGRSWAIHDGILGDRWVPPSMYKFVGREFRTDTCPGVPWSAR